jgi:hypothetical protein
MPYHPQFSYPPTPEGYTDEEFVYVFNSASMEQLGVILLPGQSSLNIPLQLQADGSEFHVREIQIGNAQAALGVRFRDPEENYINESGSGQFVSSVFYSSPSGDSGAILEPEMVCPSGAAVFIDVANLT